MAGRVVHFEENRRQGQNVLVSNLFVVSILLFLWVGLCAQPLHAVEVNAGEDQIVAMHDLADPNSPIDPNLSDPSNPAWPFPFATAPSSPAEPQPVVVKLNGSHTADANTPVTIAWSLTDAGQASHVLIDDVGVLDPNVTFDEPNLYSLTLTVDDGTETVTDTVFVKVKLVGHALQAHWKFDADPDDPNDYDWNYTDFTGAPDFGPGLVGNAVILKPGDSVSYGNAIGAETSVSVAFWMKPAADFTADSSRGLVRKYSGTSADPQGGWTFQLRSETELRWRCSSGYDNGAGDLKVVDDFSVDTWIHLVGTYDGETGGMKFYRNGQLLAERTTSDTCFDSFLDEMTVGSHAWSGMIDELYVFDYPLTTDEIRPLIAKGRNVAPNVSVARQQIKIVLPDNEVALSGTVIEEGAYNARWSVVEGPQGAAAVIDDAQALETSVRFDVPGNYLLRLTATDQGTPPLSLSAEVIVKVRPADFDGLEAHITFADQNADSQLPSSVRCEGQLFGGPQWVQGLGGEGDYAILLDGIDDHINYDRYLGSDPCCTIALWVGNDAIEDDTYIIQKWAADSSHKGWMIRSRSSGDPGQLVSMIGSGYGTGAFVMSDAYMPLTAWTHLAITFDGTTFNIYMNGEQVASDIITNPNISPEDLVTPMVVGYRWNSAQYYFTGAIDEIRIYDYALTAEDMAAIYTADGGQ